MGTASCTFVATYLRALALLALVAAAAPLPSRAADVVEAYPGDDLQGLVDASPPATRFLLKEGLYRGQRVRPQDGDTFTGEPGAVLSGAVVLSGWTHDDPYWTVSGQTAAGRTHGNCKPDSEGCIFPEDLFFDDEPLRQETKLADLDAPGEWFFDYEQDRIYVLDDPREARVELSVTPDAFHGSANDVTVRGLTIEKYATPAQHGAIHIEDDGSGWLVEGNLIRWNHGLGIRTAQQTRVLHNWIVSNGQLGLGGGRGRDVLVEENVIAWNNYAGFRPTWEAGGAKWALMEGLTLRGNQVVENDGPGLWADIDCEGVVYEDNDVHDNTYNGIFHEISQAAVIRRNRVSGNGAGFDPWLYGAQILISASRDVEVYENTVAVGENGGNGITVIQQKRGEGLYGPRISVNNSIHHNRVTYLGDGGVSGGAADWDADTLYQGHNVFDFNTYVVRDPHRRHWAWQGKSRSWEGWRARGQDPHGTLEVATVAAAEAAPAAKHGGGSDSRCGLLGIEPLLVLLWLRRRRRQT